MMQPSATILPSERETERRPPSTACAPVRPDSCIRHLHTHLQSTHTPRIAPAPQDARPAAGRGAACPRQLLPALCQQHGCATALHSQASGPVARGAAPHRPHRGCGRRRGSGRRGPRAALAAGAVEGRHQGAHVLGRLHARAGARSPPSPSPRCTSAPPPTAHSHAAAAGRRSGLQAAARPGLLEQLLGPGAGRHLHHRLAQPQVRRRRRRQQQAPVPRAAAAPSAAARRRATYHPSPQSLPFRPRPAATTASTPPPAWTPASRSRWST
jgi:hypothetical protein